MSDLLILGMVYINLFLQFSILISLNYNYSCFVCFYRILASLYSGTVCIWNYQTQVWECTVNFMIYDSMIGLLCKLQKKKRFQI